MSDIKEDLNNVLEERFDFVEYSKALNDDLFEHLIRGIEDEEIIPINILSMDVNEEFKFKK